MRVVALLLALLATTTASAAKLVPDLSDAGSLPTVTLPVGLVQKGLAAAAQHKGLPLQFAVQVPMNLGLANGTWDPVSGESARWRLKLFSAGAVSLQVQFSRLRMPAGAALWFYDSQGKLVQGPYTHASENPDGQLATAVVLGDTALLELQVPAALRNQAELSVSDVFHGYRDISKAGGFGSAGACERDVVCPEGNNWSNEIRAAGLLTISGTLCSGTLVNNSRQDDTAFFLTANHCGLNSGNASNVTVYWNFKEPSCGSNAAGDLSQNTSGATFLTSQGGSGADFALIRLNSSPASFGVYFAGWDVSGNPVTAGAGIHHPQGDTKKISIVSSADKVNNACAADNGTTCTLAVDGWVTAWSSGVTEQGSSGSGLWDQNHHVVGTLSGGASNCNGSSSNGQPDVYARLDAAWNSGVPTLKSQLDPSGSGVTALNGRCPAGTGCGAAPATDTANHFGGGMTELTLSILGLFAALARITARRRASA